MARCTCKNLCPKISSLTHADAKDTLTRTVAIASRACSALFGPAAIDVSMDACAAVSDDAADAVMSFAWPVAIFIAVPRTSNEVRRPKINALWLRVSSNALRLRKSPSEEVFAELVAEILCA